MAIYSVQAPDGNVYDINGPEGASEADLFAATRQLMGQARAASLQQQIEELRTTQARPEEVSGFGAAKAAAWQNLQADLAAVAGKTGVMSEEAAEKIIAEKKKEAARVFTPTENWSDAPWTKFKELVGGSLPYMAAPVAAGVAAVALPASLPAAAIGAGLAGLASATQFTGSNLSRQLEEQEGDKKSLAKTELAPAIAGAIPQAALDVVSFRMMPIVGRAFKSVGKELTEEQLKQVAERGLLNNMGRGGLKTGSVESLTETGQQLIERLQAGLSITDEKARAEYLESAIGGGALGFPLGALGGVGARGRARNKLAEIEAGRKPPEEEQKTGTALALMGERGVAVPETPVQETPVEFMGRENVPAAEQEQVRQLEDRTRVPTTAEAVRVNPDGTTGKVVANVPGAAPGQQGVLNIFDGEDVTARELGQRMGAVQQVPDVYPETNAPRLAAPATKDPRQGALQFAPAAPETPDGQLQEQLIAVQKQRAFEAAEQQREEQKQAELGLIVRQAAEQEDKTQPTFPEAKPGQPTQQEQLSLFNRKQAPTPSRAEGIRRGVGEQIEPEAPPQPQAIVTAQALDVLGIPKSAPAYRLSLGKDLADPEQRLSVSNTLRRLAANPNTKSDVRTNIENVLQMSPFVQVQGELFGPGGGKTNQPTLKTLEARNANVPESTGSTTEPAAESGASEPSVEVGGASVESKTGTESAAGVPKSKGRGLASADRGAKPDTARKTKAQPAVAEEEELSQEEQDALQAELDAELAGEAVEAVATTEEQAETKGIDWDFINKEVKRLKRKVADAERVNRRAEIGSESKAAKAKLAKVNEEFDAFLAKWNPIIKAAADKTIAESEAKAKAKAEPEAEPEAEPTAKKETQAKAKPKAEPKAEPEAEPEAEIVNPEWEEITAKETNEYQKWFAANVQKYKHDDKKDIGERGDTDRRKVGSLLRGPAKAKQTTTSDLLARNSAWTYFSKMSRLVDNLRNIAFDIATNAPRFREGTQNIPASEAKFFKGMSATAAKHARRWVQANLSDAANAKLDEIVIAYKKEQLKFADKNFTDKLLGHDATREEYVEANDKDLVGVARALLDTDKPVVPRVRAPKTKAQVKAASEETIDTTSLGWDAPSMDDLVDNFGPDLTGQRKSFELNQDAVSRLGTPLHPAIRAMLEAGNLKGALDALAGQSSGIVQRIVQLLAGAVGGTRVEVVNNLIGEDGKPAAGLFDPATNTIRLDSKTGINNHTLIHEMTHGALSHILDNPNHPVTRQLTKIFDSVKPFLDTAYGAQSLQEFVAEAWGNVEFRQKLSALHPDGSPISAWQKFVNSVKNFMRSMIGMEHKGIESAFDRTDRLMEAIISPAPGMRTAGSLYMMAASPSATSAFFNSMGKAYSNIPYFSTETKDAFRNVFSARIPDAIRRFLLSALPANALSDVAESVLPMARQFDKLVHLKSGQEGKLYSEVEPTINRVRDWAKKQSADTIRTFNKVVYDSTINRVDPSKPRSAYVDKYGNSLTDPSGNKLADAWDDLQPLWKELQKNGGAEVYITMRDTYKKLYDKIGAILKTRLDDEFGKSKEADKAYGMLKKLFDERGTIEPYFPLTRRGDYWLSYNMAVFNPDGTPKSNEQYIEAFETKVARDRAVADLKEMADTDKNIKLSEVNEFRKGEKISYSNAPSSSFMGRVLDVLEVNNVGEESREAIMELYLNALPENSFAQSFRNRKDTLGFDQDAIRAFSNKTYGITRQLANVEYGAKFQQLGNDISKYVRKLTGNKEQAQMYEREFAKRIKFVLHPEVSEWSKLSTAIGFNAFLGFNLSSAIVNLTQLPLVTLPYLGGKYGYSETMKAMGEATRLFASSGFKDRARVDILGVQSDVAAGPSIANYDWSDPSKLPKEIRKYAALVSKALDWGQLNRSQIFDILAVDKTDSVSNKVNAMSGFMFHHGERMNREVTLAAAYDLELQRMKSDPTPEEAMMTTAQQQERAAENAINITELTNGSASASAAPSLAQGNIGRIIFMFKRYGVSMYYMLFKTAMDVAKGQDSKTKAAALRQIAGIYGSSALLAGLKGVPMFGIAAMIWNMLKDDDDDDFETQVRKWTNETVYSGALNGLTNLEFASRIGLSDLIFRDQKAPESQTALLTALETLGGPVYGVGKKFERGVTLIGEGHIERGVEQMLPSAIGNMLKGVRFATEGATTLRGDPIVSDVNAWNAGAQMFGFAPADYIAQQEINASLKGFERAVTKQQKSLLLNYYMAARQGDSEAIQDITQQMGEFNRKHPTLAISGDTLRRSMQTHARASAQKYHGLTFNRKLLPEIMASEREFHGE